MWVDLLSFDKLWDGASKPFILLNFSITDNNFASSVFEPVWTENPETSRDKPIVTKQQQQKVEQQRVKTTICLNESRLLNHLRLLRPIRELKPSIKPDVKKQCSQTQQAYKYVATQRPRVWCQTPPAAVKTDKVIVVWQKCQKNVDKVKYSARRAWDVVRLY